MLPPKRQLALAMAVAAFLLHVLCFDWAASPPFFASVSDPPVFFQIDFSGITGKEGSLFLLYDYSYGYFNGLMLLLTLLGIFLPFLLLLTSSFIYWNDYQAQKNR